MKAFFGQVTSFFRTIGRNNTSEPVLTANIGSGLERRGYVMSPPGDDSPPLDNDVVLLVPTPRTGTFSMVGAGDPINQGQAKQGEKRLYSRSSDGEVQAVIHMKADGSVVVNNGSGTLTLEASGNITITGDVTIDGDLTVDGGITVGEDVVAGPTSVSLTTHTHGGVTSGGSNTLVPNGSA